MFLAVLILFLKVPVLETSLPHFASLLQCCTVLPTAETFLMSNMSLL